VLRAGTLRLDVHARRVWVGDVDIAGLCAKEYKLLLAMIDEPERVFTREELLRSVWGFSSPARTRTDDSHAARLRARLGAGGGHFVHNFLGVASPKYQTESAVRDFSEPP